MKKMLLAVLAIILCSMAAQAQISSEMYRRGKNLCIDNERLSSEQALNLLGEYNYYKTYVGARKQVKAGKGLIISGCCALVLGAAVEAYGLAELDAGTYYTGIITVFLGSGMLSAGIPLLCVGKARLNWCAEDYNLKARQEPALSLNFGAQRYGTGLALRF